MALSALPLSLRVLSSIWQVVYGHLRGGWAQDGGQNKMATDTI